MKTKAPALKKARTRILIVDDHPIVRKGIADLVGQKPDFLVCGDADRVDHPVVPDLPQVPRVVGGGGWVVGRSSDTVQDVAGSADAALVDEAVDVLRRERPREPAARLR